MGLGLATLANTRPYEGLVYSIPIAIALFVWMFSKSSPSASVLWGRVVAPLGIMLLIVGIAMGYYNWRVTGSPLLMPHRVGELTYTSVPKFLWQHPRQITFHYQVFRDWDRVELMLYNRYHMHLGLFTMSVLKFVLFWLFYLGPLFTLPLATVVATLPAGFSWRQMSTDTRFLLLLCGTSFLGFGLETLFNNYYAAPITGPVILLVIIAAKHLRNWQRSSASTVRLIARAVPALAVASLLARCTLYIAPSGVTLGRLWCSPWSPDLGRARIAKLLDSDSRHQLVLVRYNPDHVPISEWVYNDADIDNSKIVWAREMDPKSDAELLNYFKDRRTWLLEADEKPPKLLPYGDHPLSYPVISTVHDSQDTSHH